MPWSPIPKFPEIFNNLKKRGIIKEATHAILTKEIMKVVGVIKESTISRIIEVMETLDYIKKNQYGTWDILYWMGEKEKERLKEMEIKNDEERINKMMGLKK